MGKLLFFKAHSKLSVEASFNDHVEDLIADFDCFVRCYPTVEYTYEGKHPSGKYIWSADERFNYQLMEYRFEFTIVSPDLHYINRVIDALNLLLLPIDAKCPEFCFELD